MIPFLSRLRTSKKKAGILIVNGGKDPEGKKWLTLCLNQIKKHTKWPNYKVYIWNNNIHDTTVALQANIIPGSHLVQKPDELKLAHVHAVPLQMLYKLALKDGMNYIVTIDTDAFPIKDNWLTFLISKIDKKTVLAGVWRNELSKGITPYIHPSCLCTSVDFIKKYKIPLDFIDQKSEKKIDTLGLLSKIATENNLKFHKLERSNVNQLHYLMGGLYGDLIYHHGAGSRKNISFWGEERTKTQSIKNDQINQKLQKMLFHNLNGFVDWMLGKNNYVS